MEQPICDPALAAEQGCKWNGDTAPSYFPIWRIEHDTMASEGYEKGVKSVLGKPQTSNCCSLVMPVMADCIFKVLETVCL
jgi:hypothetical protein